MRARPVSLKEYISYFLLAKCNKYKQALDCPVKFNAERIAKSSFFWYHISDIL